MKIVAQYNPNSGGSYHRVKLWAEFMENVTLVEEITEDLLDDCNILYIHWNLNKLSIPQLSIWREKYRFKIVVDIDDTWDLETKYQLSVIKSQHLCLLADHVICSTEYLKKDILEWNKNVTVIPNLIPFGHGQFTPRIKQHPKLRIGIGGSISHHEDYLSLRGTIKHLEKQRWFRDNCEFAIIGYDPRDTRWNKIASMFKNVKLFGHKSPEDYMRLYDELDVMLLPLLDTPVNRGRSNLKIWECICKNVIPIVSNTYTLDHELIVLKEPYVNRLELIVNHKDKNLNHWVAGRKDYKILCVSSRLDLFKELSYHTFTPPSKHALYSITYREDQNVEYTNFPNIVHTVEEKSYLFEYNPIIEIVNLHFLENRKYTGIFSHKFPFKTGYYRKLVEQILNNEDADVVVFCKQEPRYLTWSEQQHPGLLSILTLVCSKLDITLTEEPEVTVYSNFFAAKTRIYQEYIEFLERAIKAMEEPDIKELVWQDSGYKSGLDSGDLKKYTGLDYYPFHTFILERLMSIWIDYKGLTYSIYE